MPAKSVWQGVGSWGLLEGGWGSGGLSEEVKRAEKWEEHSTWHRNSSKPLWSLGSALQGDRPRPERQQARAVWEIPMALGEQLGGRGGFPMHIFQSLLPPTPLLLWANLPPFPSLNWLPAMNLAGAGVHWVLG